MKILPLDELKLIAGNKGYNLLYIEKDYYLTVALYLLRNLDGLVFKGGTALGKTLLNHARLSEDLDFTVTKEKDAIVENLEKTLQDEHFTTLKKAGEKRFTRRYKLTYDSELQKDAHILLDLNFIAKPHYRAQIKQVKHFYKPHIPAFNFTLLAQEELIAEKVRAMITRNQPRDYYDVYQLIKKGYKINMKLVKKKVIEAGQVFDIERVFRRANRVYSNWGKDLTPLVKTPVDFKTAIKTIERVIR